MVRQLEECEPPHRESSTRDFCPRVSFDIQVVLQGNNEGYPKVSEKCGLRLFVSLRLLLGDDLNFFG